MHGQYVPVVWMYENIVVGLFDVYLCPRVKLQDVVDYFFDGDTYMGFTAFLLITAIEDTPPQHEGQVNNKPPLPRFPRYDAKWAGIHVTKCL